MKRLPADCFGFAAVRLVECVDDSVLDASDNKHIVDGKLMVETEVVHWLKRERKVKKKPQVSEETDTCWLDNAGEPGSQERIAALAEHYAKYRKADGTYGEDGISPFVLTDNEAAERLTDTFLFGNIHPELPMHKALLEIAREAIGE